MPVAFISHLIFLYLSSTPDPSVSFLRNSSAGRQRGTSCQPNPWKFLWSRGGLHRPALSQRMTFGWDINFFSFLYLIHLFASILPFMLIFCITEPQHKWEYNMRQGYFGPTLSLKFPTSLGCSSHEPLHCMWRSHLSKNKYISNSLLCSSLCYIENKQLCKTGISIIPICTSALHCCCLNRNQTHIHVI